MGTFKLQLTEDDWFAALRGEEPNRIADGLHAQQPELYGRLLSREMGERQKKHNEAEVKAAQEKAEAEAKAKAEAAAKVQIESTKLPEVKTPADAPPTVKDATPKASVRPSAKADKP